MQHAIESPAGVEDAVEDRRPTAGNQETGVGPHENPLSKYLEIGFQAIAGWLHPPAMQATLFLADLHAAAFAPGPVCEIGVWEARYLTLLSFLPATPQRVVGVDPFIHGGNREAQLQRVRANIEAYARRPDLVTLIERDSRQVSADDLLQASGGPCQFVSVDGDHTLDGALGDLRLAEQVLAEGGIVSVDDISNMTCPGVVEAVVRYGQRADATLAPFLLVANKLFMTQRHHCEGYREAILAGARRGDAGEWGLKTAAFRERMQAIGVPVRLVGEDLLVCP